MVHSALYPFIAFSAVLPIWILESLRYSQTQNSGFLATPNARWVCAYQHPLNLTPSRLCRIGISATHAGNVTFGAHPSGDIHVQLRRCGLLFCSTLWLAAF